MTRLCRWERCRRPHVEHSPWCSDHRDELLRRMYAASPQETGTDVAGKASSVESTRVPIGGGAMPVSAAGGRDAPLSRPSSTAAQASTAGLDTPPLLLPAGGPSGPAASVSSAPPTSARRASSL